jgi:antitoxin (DNA-binding transcriptional repressor) of toxin-antitoxin stability system
MTVVTIHTAKTTLSQLLARMEAGEEIVIARGKTPVARLAPVEKALAEPERPVVIERRPGRWKGMINIPDSFFDPVMTEEELDQWENSGI